MFGPRTLHLTLIPLVFAVAPALDGEQAVDTGDTLSAGVHGLGLIDEF